MREKGGYIVDWAPEAAGVNRRQEVSPVYRINGCLYLWRAGFVQEQEDSWRARGRNLLYEIPESRAMSIDTLEEFEKAEALVRSGFLKFSWLAKVPIGRCVH